MEIFLNEPAILEEGKHEGILLFGSAVTLKVVCVKHVDIVGSVIVHKDRYS
jgi:hypothetical protein